jgi:hypothetical protein
MRAGDARGRAPEQFWRELVWDEDLIRWTKTKQL